MNMTLAIMAAGLGSRFGGYKQTAEIIDGLNLMDFTIGDAFQIGYEKCALIISKELEPYFLSRYSGLIRAGKLETVVQHNHLSKEDFPGVRPETLERIAGRKKPLGTGHALLSAAPLIQGDFVTIANADDYYTREGLIRAGSLAEDMKKTSCSAGLVTYRLGNTLSEFGSVSRGICDLRNEDGRDYLKGIREWTSIEKQGERIFDGSRELESSAAVSVNLWNFRKDIFNRLKDMFTEFLQGLQTDEDFAKKEFYFHAPVNEMLANGGRIPALMSDSHYLGMTYGGERKLLEDYFRSNTTEADRRTYREMLLSE